jgi:hypothetical protein
VQAGPSSRKSGLRRKGLSLSAFDALVSDILDYLPPFFEVIAKNFGALFVKASEYNARDWT